MRVIQDLEKVVSLNERLVVALELLAEFALALQVASQANKDGGWNPVSSFQGKISELFEKLAAFSESEMTCDCPTCTHLKRHGYIADKEPEAARLYGKYRIAKADGSPIDPDAQYFVLRIDTDQAAREALKTYAEYIEYDEPDFAAELHRWLTATAGKTISPEAKCR